MKEQDKFDLRAISSNMKDKMMFENDMVNNFVYIRHGILFEQTNVFKDWQILHVTIIFKYMDTCDIAVYMQIKNLGFEKSKRNMAFNENS